MKFSEIELPSNRKFGWFFTAVFILIAGYCFYYGFDRETLIFSLIAILFFITTLTKPSLLLPLNILWMRIGYLLGKIISPIVLGIIFYGIFTPVGVLTRLFGRDELNLNPVKNDSVWNFRKQKVNDGEYSGTFEQQF